MADLTDKAKYIFESEGTNIETPGLESSQLTTLTRMQCASEVVN